MRYDCKFLGAAEDIGRLGFVLGSRGQKYLFDYGIAPENPPQYPLPSPAVDQMFLTHAHMDHSGMVPWMANRHDGTIMTTEPTAKVSHLMHRDAVKIAHSEGYQEPYSYEDIDDVDALYQHVNFEEQHEIGEAISSFHSAGHIPGAGQVRMEDDDGTFVFTGDLYTRPQRLVGAGKPQKCDVLAMETTYSGREHEDRKVTEKNYLGYVEDRVDRGGKVVTACFAVGRAQEIAMVLQGQGYNVWIDGMARQVARIFGEHPEYLADARAYQRAMGELKFVYNHRGRGVALKDADVILTTSGMLEGGPALYYLDHLRNDPNSGLAITGYQAHGTNGRRLMDTGELDMDPRDPGKKIRKLNLPVEKFDFSAHAGHSDLVDFAKTTGAQDVILFHGDQREHLAEDIKEFANVHMPMRGEEFVIEQ